MECLVGQGDKNPNVKLSWDKVDEIRSRWEKKEASVKELSVEYDITATNVRHILKNKTWRKK